MAKTENITQEYLRSIVDYNPETGIFRWSKVRYGTSVGKIAGTLTDEGYVQIMIDRVGYRAHRLAWLYVHGYMPGEVDHIDQKGLKSDNRLCNLRPATSAQNKHNKGLTKRNTSGYKGVSYDKSRNKYCAAIMVNGKTTHLGRFNTAEDAHKAYCKAAHELHGNFARTA